MKRNQKGFTLIELLIVVAIIGIIVAIAIPNLLNAIQRAKQKRTMGDMRSAGTAAEAYAVDFNHYPAAAGYTIPSGVTFGGDLRSNRGRPPASRSRWSPTYIRVLPLTDGWQSFFLYGRPSRPTPSARTARTGRRTRSSAERRRLQRRHHFLQRTVRPVPRGRAAVSPPVAAPSRAPSRGLFLFLEVFRAPRIPAVKRGLATGRTALLGGALGLAFAAALLGPGALLGLVPARGDLADFFWPMKAYTAARWAAGGLPLWNPLSGCGEPWLAQLQTGVLYPGDLPFLLGGAAGPLAALALHLGIAAAGMAAWLSDLGTSRAGRSRARRSGPAAGAFLVARAASTTTSARRRSSRGSSSERGARCAAPRPAPFALAVALAFLAGEPALAAAGAAAAVLVAVATRGEDATRPAPPRGARPPSGGGRGRPGRRARRGGARAVPRPRDVDGPDRGRDAGRGSRAARRPRRPRRPRRAARGRRTRARRRRGAGGYLATLALGPLAFVLAAAAGAGFAARPRLLLALLALAALSVLLALGSRGGLVPLLWDGGLARGVRFPARWIVFGHLALAAAAGAGLDGWRDGHLLAWPKRATHESEPPAKTARSSSRRPSRSGRSASSPPARSPSAGSPASPRGRRSRARPPGRSLLWTRPIRLRAGPHAGRGRAPRSSASRSLSLSGPRDVFAGVPAVDLARPPRVVADLPSGSPGRVFPVVSDGALLKAWLGGAWTEDTPRRAHEALAGYGTLPLGLASAASPSPITNPLAHAPPRRRAVGRGCGSAPRTRGRAARRDAVPHGPAGRDGSSGAPETSCGTPSSAPSAASSSRATRRPSTTTPSSAHSRRARSSPRRALSSPRAGERSRRPARPRGYAVAKVTHDAPETLEIETATSERRRPRRHARVGLGLGGAAGRRARRAAPRAISPSWPSSSRRASTASGSTTGRSRGARARPSPGARSSSSSASSSRAGKEDGA